MSIEYLENDDYWKADIYWKPKRKWYRKGDIGVDLSEDDFEQYGIYRFEGQYNNRNELLYIGIAYDQNFDCRLHQGYYENKLKYVRADQVFVSVGIIDLNSSIHVRKRYEEIEALLIYFTQPKLNFKKKEYCPDGFYIIRNLHHKGVLPKIIKFPVAEIKY